MRTLSSTEFRRTFAQLTEPVTVTVLGRPIAEYTPISAPLSIRVSSHGLEIDPAPSKGRKVSVAYDSLGGQQPVATFRPAPKPVRKKR